MTTEELLAEIYRLGQTGGRGASFKFACQLAIERGVKHIVETGCYRGIPGDGYSTKILALLAQHTGAQFCSYDITPEHVQRAKELLQADGLLDFAQIKVSDSLSGLWEQLDDIGLLYLDSWDYNPNDPLESQMHQLAEVGAAFHSLSEKSIVMMDDYLPQTGGKTGLTTKYLKVRGWKPVFEAYQLVYVKA